jgi:energy-coupling factor transporter ATP-binding protein EcfA2
MHSLIIGMTESGKTTLAKILAAQLKKQGKKIAVLDPLNDPEWGNVDFLTNDPDEFLDYCKSNKSHYCFIDEGSISIGRNNDDMQWFPTQSRHWGHSCFFLTQGLTQLSPIVRAQCSVVFCFAVGERDTDSLAEEWREKSLKKLNKIGKGEFYIVSRFSPLRKGTIDFRKRKVYYDVESNSEKVSDADSKPKKPAGTADISSDSAA